MKLNKREIFIVAIAIESLYLHEGKCHLNEEGVIELAKIQSKFAEQLLPINSNDVVKSLTERMLENVNYIKTHIMQVTTE
jgi:hypothetical protein